MIKTKSPVIYLYLYILVSLSLWFSQSTLNYNFSYGAIVIIVAYVYFYLGCFAGMKIRVYEQGGNYRSVHNLQKINTLIRFLTAINVIILIYLGLLFRDIISQVASLNDYRSSLFKDQSIKDYYGSFAAYLFVYATIVPLFGISYGLYLKINKNQKSILFMSFMLLTAKEAILISRYYVFAPVLAAILLLYCYDNKMTKKKVIMFVSIFTFLLLSMFIYRGESDVSSNIINARNYVIAGYSLLSNVIDSKDLNVFYDLSSPFSFLGILGTRFYDQTPFFAKVQEFVYLGNGGYFNAFYTSLLFPFLYFGAAGLSLLSLGYGFLISINHKKFISKNRFINFNTLFALLVIFFSHQFLPVQLSFFWDYLLISLSMHLIVICVDNIRDHL